MNSKPTLISAKVKYAFRTQHLVAFSRKKKTNKTYKRYRQICKTLMSTKKRQSFSNLFTKLLYIIHLHLDTQTNPQTRTLRVLNL